MNRSSTLASALCSIAACAGLVLAAIGFHGDARAQVQRLLPAKAVRGTIHFTAPPQIVVDGKPDRLGPGVRVYDERNRIALTGALRDKTYEVKYLRDAAGVIREVWILTPRELERERSQGVMRNTGPGASEYLN